MADLSQLLDLSARLDKATGPDRELDALIATTIGGYVYEKRGRDQKPWFYPVDERVFGRRCLHGVELRLFHYTASIDAAVALCARVLPGWEISLSSGADGAWAWVNPLQPYPAELEQGANIPDDRKQIALALCRSIVAAKIAEARANG